MNEPVENRSSSGLKLSPWILLFVAILLVFGTLWFSGYFNNGKIQKAETEKKVIETKRDSTGAKQSEDRAILVENAKSRSEQSHNISKPFTNEKIIIRDTTYSAMCDYIRSYRPE
jgi:hypothetical protein